MSNPNTGGNLPNIGMFLYGGCVSRDSFTEMETEAKLTGYVARQSLISAFNRPARIKPIELPSNFQNRMVRGDISSDFIDKLEPKIPETDVIVIDLLVERLGVSRIRGGSFVTMSSELKKSRALEAVAGQTRSIRFGTDEHFAHWCEAAVRFSVFLTENNMKSKTLLLETPWADITDTGARVRGNATMSAEEANEKYERYYKFLSDECKILNYRLPDDHIISAEKHRWGVAPYHYIKPAYLGIVQRIREVARSA